MKRTLRLADACLLVAVSLVWGLNFVVIRWGLASMPPLMFSAFRFLACAFPFVFFIRRPNIGALNIILIGFVLGVGVFGFLFVGIASGMPAGLASLVMQLQVFFTVVFSAVALGERPPGYRWIAMLIGSAGIVLIAHEQASSGTAAGLSLVLAGALSWGVANVLLKRMPASNMLSVMVWISLIPPLPLLAIFTARCGWQAVGASITQVTWTGVVAVLYTALASTIFGYGVWGAMLRRYEASAVTPFALLVPVFGLASSWVVFGEQYSPEAAGACGLILAALLLSSFGHLAIKRLPFQPV